MARKRLPGLRHQSPAEHLRFLEAEPPPRKKAGYLKLKRLPKKVLAVLSNLPLAIAEMFAVAALMALWTFIEQGGAPNFYMQKFSEDNPILGFFTWRWILALGFSSFKFSQHGA